MSLDLRPDHLQMVRDILQKHVPQYEVWAFGSRAKWTAKDYSDLDLCVVSDKPLSFSVLGAMAEDFSDSDLPWKVDVVDWATTSESFRKIIERDKVVVQEAKPGGGMACKRRYIPASEFCASVRDGTHDSPKPVEQGRRLVTSRHLTSGRLELSEAYLISNEDFEAINKRSKVDRWDVLISMIGTVGEPCLIRDEPDFAIKNIGLFKTKNETDGKWLYYYLRSEEAQQSIHEQSRGTTQQYIPLGALRDFPILITDDPTEQKAIAHILGTLDDKIELNRRMNATLEAMARALFQSWFVDFDPVRAKLDGRNPAGLDTATAALFPAHFQESPLGHIPQGWEAAEIGKIADVIDCLHAKKPERCDTGYIYLQLNNIRDDGLIDITDTYFVSEADYQKWISRMEATEDVCVITNVGRVGAVAQIPEGVKAALGRNMTGIRCKPSYQYPTFLLECLLSGALREEIRMKMDTGTILDALNVKNIPKLRFVLPPVKIMDRYELAARPLRRKMEQNLAQSRTLATIRDALLPRLLSGELSVGAPEKLAEPTATC